MDFEKSTISFEINKSYNLGHLIIHGTIIFLASY